MKRTLLDLSLVTASSGGWFSIDTKGEVWILQAGTGRMIGKCEMKEDKKWQGTFYHMSDMLMDRYYTYRDTETLCECVEFVEHLTIGGYYL